MRHQTPSLLRARRTLAALGRTLAVATIVALLAAPGHLVAQDAPQEMPPPQYVPASAPLDEFTAQPGESVDMAAEPVVAAEAISEGAIDAIHRVYLPNITKESTRFRADRIGFGLATSSLSRYGDIRSLGAGWYLNWTVKARPEQPAGIRYVQLIRIHQKLTCQIGTTADRVKCPYVTPYDYEYAPSRDAIQAAARANPGAVWIIGNEPDRLDWAGGRQDEMVPELYARAYHELRKIIKDADGGAKIAIAGIIQFTPLRRDYLNRVWNEHLRLYGTPINVDIWNVHNFIGSETCQYLNNEMQCFGMGIPPGYDRTEARNVYRSTATGAWIPAWYINRDNLHLHIGIFAKQIEEFRAWMAARGQAGKPLWVTEYGALYTTLCPAGASVPRDKCISNYNLRVNRDLGDPGELNDPSFKGLKNPGYVELDSPGNVAKFMTDTFDYFSHASNAVTGMPGDNHKLVQRWLWFSLDYPARFGLNPHSSLYNSETRQLTAAGVAFRAYTADRWQGLADFRP